MGDGRPIVFAESEIQELSQILPHYENLALCPDGYLNLGKSIREYL